jgi:hypothetical protein
LIKESFPLDEFDQGLMVKARPYIELYTDFILRFHEEEFEASK